MTLLLVALAVGLGTAAWVVVPIVRRRAALIGDPVAGGIVDAESRKRVALASLREIEYDRIAGKLDDEDYATLRARLEHEALIAMDAAAATEVDAERGAVTATHACGFVNPPGSRFCSGCGARL